MKITIESSNSDDVNEFLSSLNRTYERVGNAEGQLSAKQDEVYNLNQKLSSVEKDLRNARESLARVGAVAPDTVDPELYGKLATIFRESMAGNKIMAIKLVRELTRCGLKEAKDLVEGNAGSPAPRW